MIRSHCRNIAVETGSLSRLFWKGFGLSEYAAAFCVIDDLIEISRGMICGNFPVLYIKEENDGKIFARRCYFVFSRCERRSQGISYNR